jgi:hypothetical protein
MAAAYPAAQAAIQAALDSAAANLQSLEAAGPQAWVDYSVDGESYQYVAAKAALLKSISEYQAAIQSLDGPWILRS